MRFFAASADHQDRKQAPWQMDRKTIFLFFLFFLLSPYVLLIGHSSQLFSSIQNFDWAETFWALKNSFWQSFFSSLLSMCFAFFLFLGLGQFRYLFANKKYLHVALEILILSPSFLPALFLLLVIMSLIQPFPIGMLGVIFLHAVMNAGLVAVMLDQIYQEKLDQLAQMAVVFGSSQLFFLKKTFSLIVRDLLSVFVFVFVLCFASFSIPLIAGGGTATTLEILIFEKIRFAGQWGDAIFLSVIQLLCIFIFAFNPFKAKSLQVGRARSQFMFFRSWLGLLSVAVYVFVFTGYFLWQSLQGTRQLLKISGLLTEAFELIPSTLFLGLSVGFVILFLLLFSLWGAPNPKLQRLISGLASPSTALLGLALLLLPLPFALPPELKWIFGFSYLIFTTLYRWGWQPYLDKLVPQIVIAELMGAAPMMIYRKIILPQTLLPACRLAGVASFWAVGDFSLGKLLLPQDVTLSLLIESLLSSYRLDAALALMSLLLLLGGLCYLFFALLQRGLRQCRW